MTEKKSKKYFRDLYSNPDSHKGGLTNEREFIGLIPLLGKLLPKVFLALFSVVKFFKPLLIIIIVCLVIFFAIKYAPEAIREINRVVQEIKWDESPEALKNKDHLVSTEWGMCYQQIQPTIEREVCLKTDIGFLEYGLSWKAYFGRDQKGNVTISMRAYEGTFGEFFGAKYHVLFYHDLQANGRRVIKVNQYVKPFSCKNGTWHFAPGSVHNKGISYLKVNPKIIYYGKNCPMLFLSFFKL